MHFFWFYIKKIILSGDIETNPRSQSKRCQEFSIRHWNLNSIATVNTKSVYYYLQFTMSFVCQKHILIKSILPEDRNLEIPGYDLIQVDHPANSKQGSVCIYYRNSLPLKTLDIFYLQERIITFTNNLVLILDKIFEPNPFLVIALGDFNTKLSQWYKDDKTTTEGSKIANLTSQYRLKQIRNQPTHILHNSSSCIDLLFTSPLNLVMESGVHSSLHSNCHHQIISARFNLKMYYPPPMNVKSGIIKKWILIWFSKRFVNFTGKDLFIERTLMKVSILNNTISNVLSNFIPHKTITCDDKKPPWFNKNIINLIKNKNIFYKSHTVNENSTNKKEAIKALQNKLISTIENAKSEYYSKLSMKLSNPETSYKALLVNLKKFCEW